MAKFKNTVSGVVVDVDASAAMRLPGTWEALDGAAEEPKKTARKKPSRKKTEPDPEPAPEPEE